MKVLCLFVILAIGLVLGQLDIPQGSCRELLDVVFVVDGSETISENDFQKIRDNLKEFVEDQVSENSIHVGAVSFSQTLSDSISLSGNRNTLKNELDDLVHEREGTHTDLGLKEMNRIFENFGRSGVPKVGVLITDGGARRESRDDAIVQAQLAKANGVVIFAIGVGFQIDVAALKLLASAPENVLEIENFGQLSDAIAELVLEVCPTTTPVPTTTTSTTTTTEQTLITDLCDGCRRDNGIGYNHYTTCHQFIQCTFRHGYLIDYEVQTCPFGTFWSQDKLTCDHIWNVDCINDQCRRHDDSYVYKLNGNCAEYYRCYHGKTVRDTCAQYYSFNGVRCIEDYSCGAITTPATKCDFYDIPGDRCKYEWRVAGRTYTMKCPDNTIFERQWCTCKESGASCSYSNPTPVCKPDVDIQFHGDESTEYSNFGAVISNGVAYFDGHSNIKILRLANVDFRSTIHIRIRYKPAGNTSSGLTEAVVTNGDCGKSSTITIASRGSQTIYQMEFDQHGVEKNVINGPTGSGWREVEFKYDGSRMTSILNEVTEYRNIQGDIIVRSQCAFQLGHGTGLEDFIGYIDYITVSQCFSPA